MATTTRRSTSRKRSSAARRPRSDGSTRRPASRKRSRKKRQSALGSVARWSLYQVSSAPAEAYGLLIIAFGVVAGMGVYRQGAGPVGRTVEYVLALIVGRAAIAAPPTLIAIGALVVWPRMREHAGRVLAGSAVCLVTMAGLIHLFRNNKPISAPLEKLQKIGGVFGALIARPLSNVVGTWATGFVLVMLFGLGILIITRTPVSRAIEMARNGGASIAEFIRALASGRGDDEEYEDEDDEYDEDEEPEIEEWVASGPKKRKGRKRVEEDAPLGTLAGAGRPTQLAITTGDSRNYKLPPLSLLSSGEHKEVSARSIEETIKILEGTLEQFNVDAAVTGYTAGPTVTRLEIELGAGVKVNRVLSLTNEIKYSLASGELRFLAPIPGRSAIGVEVPNKTRALVTLGDVLHSPEAVKDQHPLAFALGKDISGHSVLANLTEMPHLLIAGATNSGKSSCINSMITSMLARSRPDQLRMIL
ncbi:MAG TPA: DNA translocase FtsK 4TM domain-containing protein, partial [Actinomycetota bacterium]|nr:DNA translocase FtsK 4TM domain-containing protein [Actinomycetota bacterium]